MTKRKRPIIVPIAGLVAILIPFIIQSAGISLLPSSKPPPDKLAEQVVNTTTPNSIGTSLNTVNILGLRVESAHDAENSPFLGYNDQKHSIIKPEEEVQVVIFGSGFDNFAALTFTADRSCSDMSEYIESDFNSISKTRMSLSVIFPKLGDEENFYICISEKSGDQRSSFTVVENEYAILTTRVPEKIAMIPLYVSIPFLVLLCMLSGLFSGLNIGLMAISPFELKVYMKSGSPKEREYAAKIFPVRERGNMLLCTLLIGNVLVNSAVSLLLDMVLGSGVYALIFATIGITIFGEIIPQAICVEHGLMVGAYSAGFTRFLVTIMFPVTFLIAKTLDCFFKEDLVKPLERQKVIEMIRLGGMPDGEDDDFKMAMGALLMGDKCAKDSMTSIDDVFMLPSDLTLNPSMINQILEMGYTRIPIYENDRNNVVALLSVKDLALLDPDDNVNVMTVCRVYNRIVRHVAEDTPLRVLLQEFKKGDYHLAMVFNVEEQDEGDPVYVITGLVTLEDIIEEILQTEIVDETDTVLDNVQRKARPRERRHDMSQFLQNNQCVLGVQMQICTFQWLSYCHPVFDEKYIQPSILEKLIRQNAKKVETSHLLPMVQLGAALPKPSVLYTSGQPSDKFIVILQGTVAVEIGREKMILEAGQWHAFGMEVLDGVAQRLAVENEDGVQTTIPEVSTVQFVPDYTVVVRNVCTFLQISAADWEAAYKASILAKQNPQEFVVRVTSSTVVENQPLLKVETLDFDGKEVIGRTIVNMEPEEIVEKVQIEVGNNHLAAAPVVPPSQSPAKPPRMNGKLLQNKNRAISEKTGDKPVEEIELLPSVPSAQL